MKKVFIIALSFIYLILASGVLLNVHFCGGKVKKVSFYCGNDEDGCCGSKEKSSGCCSDKASFVKVKDNHHPNASVELVKLSFGEYLQYADAIVNFIRESPGHTPPFYIPPVLYDLPIYIKDRSFLI